MDANRFATLLTVGESEEPGVCRGSARVPREGIRTPSGTRGRLAGRRWLSAPTGEPACPADSVPFRFRIASYNVLAKCYAKARHFTRCHPNHLKWEVRSRALMEVIRELDADILCLQEVDKYERFWVQELGHLGYTGCYKRRNTDSKNDGCATFFKSDKFAKVSVDSIEFDELPDSGGRRPDFATHNVALVSASWHACTRVCMRACVLVRVRARVRR